MRTKRMLVPHGLYFAIVAIISTTSLAAEIEQADLILLNGKIITVDAQYTIGQAVAIKGSKILKVGDDREIMALAGPQCHIIELENNTVTPGLVDSHYHLMY